MDNNKKKLEKPVELRYLFRFWQLKSTQTYLTASPIQFRYIHLENIQEMIRKSYRQQSKQKLEKPFRIALSFSFLVEFLGIYLQRILSHRNRNKIPICKIGKKPNLDRYPITRRCRKYAGKNTWPLKYLLRFQINEQAQINKIDEHLTCCNLLHCVQ